MTSFPTTILEAILWGKKELAQSSFIPNPQSQSELLLSYVLKKERFYLHLHPQERITETHWKTFQRVIERRVKGEPLQYITGVQNFMGFDFMVTPDVLIPRQDTERLIEVILEWIQENRNQGRFSSLNSIKIADLGTGSGVIAITLAKLLPSAFVWAVDLSTKALQVAKKNAKNLGVESQIAFLEGDLFEPLKDLSLKSCLDIVVSNPPYVALAEKESLPLDVLEYEPSVALFALQEGLEFYKKIIPEAKYFLKPGGLLALEIGSKQGIDVATLLHQSGDYQWIRVFQDYTPLDRVVTAVYSP